MRYAIVIEKSKRNYSAYCPDVPGCVATGRTVAETVQQMKDALAFHLQGLQEDRQSIPDPVTLVEYVDVPVPSSAAPAAKRKAS